MPPRTIARSSKPSKRRKTPTRTSISSKSNRVRSKRKPTLHKKKRTDRLKVYILVSIASIFFLGFLLYKFLFLPNVAASTTSEASLNLTGDQEIYTVLLGEIDDLGTFIELELHIVQKNDNKIYSFSLPLEYLVDMAGRFGEEALKNAYRLSLSVGESPEASAEQAVLTVQNMFAMKIDKYVISGAESSTYFDKLFQSRSLYIPDLLSFSKIKKMTSTNLTRKELLHIVRDVKSMPTSAFSPIGNLDVKDTVALDNKIANIVLNSKISKDSRSVIVLNGTSAPLIASQVARVPANAGSRVVTIENAANLYEKSYLITDEPFDLTAVYLKSYFSGMEIITKAKAEALGENVAERADITIIVGFDTLDRLL